MSRIVIVILIYHCHSGIDLNFDETLYGKLIYPLSSHFSWSSSYFSACWLLHADFFLGLLMEPEYRGNMLLQNISRLPPGCMVCCIPKDRIDLNCVSGTIVTQT
jgi:hypothetical protein